MACHAQRNQGWPDLNLDRAWDEYRYHARFIPAGLRWRFFRDTVSVNEMKTAFLRYKSVPLYNSPYEGFDTLDTSKGKAVILRSPMKDMPMKDIFAKPKLRKRLTGDIVYLALPHPYMGFMVSPYAFYEVYQDGKLVGQEGKNHDGGADFFCYAQQATTTLHGEWSDSIASGAKLMGTILHLGSATKQDWPECSFSVMVYEKSDKDSRDYPRYDVELLLPEKPNPHINFYLQSFKWFVKNLPYQTFKPYYTTDCRILLGRFYRVTVNKCGWLVEDYMDINNGEQGQQ